MAAEQDLAVSVCFAVSIDDTSLGTFNSVEGLGCEVVIETREEGGNNDCVWQLPTRMKYTNIKLSRPVGPDTSKVTNWFASLANGIKPRSATIRALDSMGKTIIEWGLIGVIPVRWTGPTLKLDSLQPATETVEIAHHGFVLDKG